MKRTSALGVFVPALAVVLVAASAPGAFAQDPRGGGGGAQGAPRGGEGGGARGGGGTSGSGPVSSGGGSTGGGTWSGGSSGGMSGGGTMGGNPGMSAVPRGMGRVEGGRAAGPRAGGGAAVAREGRPDGSTFGRSAVDDQMAGRSRAGSGSSGVESSVPWYARNRGGNPSTGTAVTRPESPAGGDRVGGYQGYGVYPWYPGWQGYFPGYGGGYPGWYDCYQYPYYGCGNAWGYGGFGLGYFYFSPFMWSYGDYASGWGGGSSGGAQMGSIRLKVKPSHASVYVDGYYAGTVDDFDNAFQKLGIALGTHKIEISAPGYQPLVFEVDVRDFDTIAYEGRLEPIR